MIELFTISSFVAIPLILWFKTEVWYEYTKLFRIGFLSGAKKYEAAKMDDMTITYIQFLRKNHHKLFVIRLITCPLCMAIWFAFLTSILFGNIILLAPAAAGGLIVYGLICKLFDI